MFASAITIELIIVRAITHGVIEVEFFTSFDIPHGDQTNLTRKPNIGLAGMIETIRWLQRQGRFQIQTFLDLEDALCKELHLGVKLVLGHNASTPQAYQLALLDWLAGKHPASAFFFKCTRVTFRV